MSARPARHIIAPGTRLYCVGTATRPCPAHAWWYHEGLRGRPRLRCDVCRSVRVLEWKAEGESANPRARCACCGRAVPCLCTPSNNPRQKIVPADPGRTVGGMESVTGEGA